jgi:hypothetical protein
MRNNFLSEYLASFRSIEGAFQCDAALLFLAYHELITAKGISGDALEIGVWEGLSAIAVAALRGEGRRFFAVDLFDDPRSQDISAGGVGDKAATPGRLIRGRAHNLSRV